MAPSTALPKGYEHLTSEMCLACKGAKALCGMPCLWLARIDARLPQLKITKQDIFGSSPPSAFVGRYGYPNITFGALLPPVQLSEERARELEAPTEWLDRRIEDVLGLRSALLRGRTPIRVRDAARPPRLLQTTQELALSDRPVDAEMHLRKRPNLELRARVGDIASPMGPSVEPDRLRLAQNPHVPQAIERIHGDDHAKASTAIAELHRAGILPYQVEKLLALGLLGRRDERRLVPTRWAITATDDQMGRALIPRVQESGLIDGVEYYEDTAHGNRFYILLLPEAWSYDMIESWQEGAMWSPEDSPLVEDYEDGRGRSKYASNITGAYYAARLSVLEDLARRRRQAAAFVYREITREYWAPLGVWLIRETVKRALTKVPLVFSDATSALAHARTRTLRAGWDRASWLLTQSTKQRRLNDYVRPIG